MLYQQGSLDVNNMTIMLYSVSTIYISCCCIMSALSQAPSHRMPFLLTFIGCLTLLLSLAQSKSIKSTSPLLFFFTITFIEQMSP